MGCCYSAPCCDPKPRSRSPSPTHTPSTCVQGSFALGNPKNSPRPGPKPTLVATSTPFALRLYDYFNSASNTACTLVVARIDDSTPRHVTIIVVASVKIHVFLPERSTSHLDLIDLQFSGSTLSDGQVSSIHEAVHKACLSNVIVAILVHEDGEDVLSESMAATDESSVALSLLGIVPKNCDFPKAGDILRYVLLGSAPRIEEPVLERPDFLKTRFQV
jgi:hypothetical protein